MRSRAVVSTMSDGILAATLRLKKFATQALSRHEDPLIPDLDVVVSCLMHPHPPSNKAEADDMLRLADALTVWALNAARNLKNVAHGGDGMAWPKPVAAPRKSADDIVAQVIAARKASE